jgi:hypothetical protein
MKLLRIGSCGGRLKQSTCRGTGRYQKRNADGAQGGYRAMNEICPFGELSA